MSLRQSRSTFDLVPNSWLESVIGLWVVVLAAFGMSMTVGYVSQLLRPLGVSLWTAVTITVFTTAVAYGVFGFGLTRLYRRYRGFEPQFVRQPFDSTAWRWLAGLGVLAPTLMVLGGLWSEHVFVVTQLLEFGFPVSPAGLGGLTFGLTGVNVMINQAPYVIFFAVLAGLLIGPAVGAVLHGVLQETLASVVPPVVAIAGTAVAATVLLTSSTVTAPFTFVVFGFFLGTAYAYHETENLVMVMAACGLFNIFALLLSWGRILAALHEAGLLVG